MNDHNFDNERSRGRRRRRGRRRDGGRPPEQQPEQDVVDVDLTVPEDKEIVIGLTGEPGAGKTSLAKEFEKLGARILDVDALGHEAIETPATKKKLVERFGKKILGKDKKIDRAKLGEEAFADDETAADLNKIVTAPLARKAKTALKKAGNFVAIDAARLHDLGLDETCTTTVYVRAPKKQRIGRVEKDRGWDEDELARREAALGDEDARRRACQLTVDNSGDLDLLGTYARTVLARQLGVELAGRKAAANGNGSGGNSPGPDPEPVHAVLNEYLGRDLPDLQREAEKHDVRDVRWLGKHDLICEILRRVAGTRADDIEVEGYIELGNKDQHGYLRSELNAYRSCNTDTFIANQQLRRYGLKAGMHVVGIARAPRGNERCPQMLKEVMGEPVEGRSAVRPFESLTPLHATQRLFLERSDKPDDYSLRIVDLVAPIGKGQRGLIVAQPKCGKTVYLQKIANAITTNNPECVLMVLLIDERPEEVTDMERSVDGEVIASTFDQHSSRHVQIAEMTINKAKRLVERGEDVVILLDSITRLARAYNAEAPNSGRIMSGGIESGALIKPKQFFGAARNIEHGGSLTILATALVDTGSVMDTVIFEEFKGTGNMELVLDRRLANKRIFPAVDVGLSGTRKDELIIESQDELRRTWALRRWLAERSAQDAIDFLKKQLKNYKTNVEFLMNIDPDKM